MTKQEKTLRKEYKKMFDQLMAIGDVLVKDYPLEQKVFEALDFVANFIGDIAIGRKEKNDQN